MPHILGSESNHDYIKINVKTRKMPNQGHFAVWSLLAPLVLFISRNLVTFYQSLILTLTNSDCHITLPDFISALSKQIHTHVSATRPGECITSCAGMMNGDYQSCFGCENMYASCWMGELHDRRPCTKDVNAQLVWNDHLKMCVWPHQHNTCSGPSGEWSWRDSSMRFLKFF